MKVDASETNDPDVKHISAVEYNAMMVNLSRMLPFYAGSEFSAQQLEPYTVRTRRDFAMLSEG